MIDEYALRLFLINIKPEISFEIQMFYPQDLTHAFNLARKVESKFLKATKNAIPYI